jgi:hypothetical protein
LSSVVVYAIELFELPIEIPMTCLSPAVVPFVVASSAAILSIFYYTLFETVPSTE